MVERENERAVQKGLQTQSVAPANESRPAGRRGTASIEGDIRKVCHLDKNLGSVAVSLPPHEIRYL